MDPQQPVAVERELRALVAVEADCCAWAQWEVTAGDVELVLRVRTAGQGVAILHGMFPDGASVAPEDLHA